MPSIMVRVGARAGCFAVSTGTLAPLVSHTVTGLALSNECRSAQSHAPHECLHGPILLIDPMLLISGLILSNALVVSNSCEIH